MERRTFLKGLGAFGVAAFSPSVVVANNTPEPELENVSAWPGLTLISNDGSKTMKVGVHEFDICEDGKCKRVQMLCTLPY